MIWKLVLSVLSFIPMHIRILSVIGLVMAGGGFVFYQHTSLKEARKDLEDARGKISAYQKQIIDLERVSQEMVSDLARIKKAQDERAATGKEIERMIRNVPQEKDGPTSPVLLDSLERLRQHRQ